MTTVNYQAYAIPNAMRSARQGGLADRLQECIALLSRVIERQRQRRVLLELDDHLLSDIGVSRRQALEEARKPFWR